MGFGRASACRPRSREAILRACGALAIHNGGDASRALSCAEVSVSGAALGLSHEAFHAARPLRCANATFVTRRVLMSAQSTTVSEKSNFIQILRASRAIPSPSSVQERVAALRGGSPNASDAELARRVARNTVAYLTTQGALVALPGVVPGIGTGAQIAVAAATMVPEKWLYVRTLAHAHYTIAALHGKHPGCRSRVDEFLLAWGAALGVSKAQKAYLAMRVGYQAGPYIAALPSIRALAQINAAVGFTTTTKFVGKRVAAASGRAIPLGVGVVASGLFNGIFAHAVMRKSVDLFVDAHATR